MELTRSRQPEKTAARETSPSSWSALAVLSLAMAAGAITARLEAGPRFDWLLLMAAIGTTGAVAMRLLADNAEEREAANRYLGDPLKDLLDSAGPIVVAVDLDGRPTFANPTAERLLGYHASEFVGVNIGDMLAPGESGRLVAELQKLCGIETGFEQTHAGRLGAYARVVHALPPSQVPSFEAHLRRRDGSILPVRLHLSTLRDHHGEPAGLVAVALDQNATIQRDQKREATERYVDVFENASEMIATLDLTGRFLYMNPAWRRYFALYQSSPGDREFFEEVFHVDSRANAAALLRRALDGETIERAQMRNETSEGHVHELELSLHHRRSAGKPLAIQCLARDVTQQRQREQRLALQLMVTQIVGENVSTAEAAKRVLEALCVSQQWDAAVNWEINAAENRLEFSTAWGVPGKDADALIQGSMGLKLAPGAGLPGRAWSEGRLVWMEELSKAGADPRVESALRHRMVSGWAIPVQVDNRVLAVLEFYCQLRQREDRETTAAMETVAASLGQMLARTRERERAEELSRQQKILLHSVADGICGADRNGLVRFANPAAARLLGAPVASLIGRPVHDLVHGWAPEGSRCGPDCPLLRAASGRVPATGEATLYRANGLGFPAEYTLNPILDMGRYSGSVISLRNITDRKELDLQKDGFISTVSHELRTPLTAIRGALGLLSTSRVLGEVSDKARNLLRMANSNSDRLMRLINDILEIERLQSGREPLAVGTVQMAELVSQAVDGVATLAESAGVTLSPDQTRVEISADPDRLLQVLTNLLSNAIKFSPPSSAVSIMLRPGSSGVTLSVIDQGRGIPADKLEKIFERFQQVDASDSRQKGGTGLGLAICREIVTQHHGRIWAERNLLRGSTFRVFLPYHPAVAGNGRGYRESAGRGMVLLASDGGATRPLIGGRLADHGYRIVETSTVEQTLVAAHHGVETIVLDCGSRAIGGWEILPSLRQSIPESHTPLILLSLDIGQGSPEVAGDGSQDGTPAAALIRELVQAVGEHGEPARILVVEDNEKMARTVAEAFSGENLTVKTALSREQAMDQSIAFGPHLVVMNIGLGNGDALHLTSWLGEQETLTRLVLVVYSGRDFISTGMERGALEPAGLLRRARVRPDQLEALLLTVLLGSPSD